MITRLPMTYHKLLTDQPGLLTIDFDVNSELPSVISRIPLTLKKTLKSFKKYH